MHTKSDYQWICHEIRFARHMLRNFNDLPAYRAKHLNFYALNFPVMYNAALASVGGWV